MTPEKVFPPKNAKKTRENAGYGIIGGIARVLLEIR
jgi:hypothetical protein